MLPSEINNTPEFLTPDFQKKVKEFKKDWYDRYTKIGKEKTPDVDGTGKKIVKPKGNTGFDYIEETYMRDRLDKHFPGWSWEMAAPLHFLGAEWVVAQGHLLIIDESLIAFHVLPPIRRFYGVDSVRIQYSKGQTHTPEFIVDVGDNCKQAVTSALKYAINRLCRIGDDVYGKRLEMEGAGTIEDILSGAAGASAELVQQTGYKAFGELLTKNHIRWSEAYEILGTNDIIDYKEAWNKIKAAKGLS